jgi:hypothetical protein
LSVRKLTIVLTAALAASLVANVYLFREWSRKTAERTYYPAEQPLIDRAVALFGAELPNPSKEQLQREMRPRFPVVSRIPDPRQPSHALTCVSLRLPAGYLGFEPVYCFDEGGNLVSHGRI